MCLSLLRGLWQQRVGHRKLSLLLQSLGTSSDLLPLVLASSKVGVLGVKVQPQPFSERAQRRSPLGLLWVCLSPHSDFKKKDQTSEKKSERRGGLALLCVHTVCHPYSMPQCSRLPSLQDQERLLEEQTRSGCSRSMKGTVQVRFPWGLPQPAGGLNWQLLLRQP